MQYQLMESSNHRSTGMDLFSDKAFRLKSERSKFLVAQEDRESVRQQTNGSEKTAVWTVELGNDRGSIRLKSHFGNYLTASDQPLIFGFSDKKVMLTSPSMDSDISATYWEPIRDGSKVKLRSYYTGGFLRGNGGAPPWRDAVTHSSARFHVYSHRDLWEVDDLDVHLEPKPESLISSPVEDPFEDIREVALLFYANCSNDERSAAVKMIKAADTDENRSISFEEFKAACLDYKFQGNIDEMFQGIDTDRNGFLDSEEAKTFYYMIKNRMLFCRHCRQCLNKAYFSCVKCCSDENVENFNVCLTCYGRQIYFHEHKEFADNNTMLNSLANSTGKSNIKGSTQTALESAGNVAINMATQVALSSIWAVST